MKLFISDLHISSPLFNKEVEIIELFNSSYIEDIYILGDVLDYWQENPDKTVFKNKDLIDTINNCGKVRVIIKGNHDPDIEKMREIFYNIPVLYKLEIELFGKRTILIHGDETDTSVRWAQFLSVFQYPFECIGLNPKAWLRNTIHKISMKRQKLSYNSLVFEAEKKLYERYCEDYKIIISGHTHLSKVIRLPKADYLNCGCILYNPSYLLADSNIIALKRF
jgi:UDP-2,3-diacylglucosamine pyrophosphatase LpxH